MNPIIIAILLAHSPSTATVCPTGQAVTSLPYFGKATCAPTSGGAPGAHTHNWIEILNEPLVWAPDAHTHAWIDITGEPATYPPSAHTHPGGDITSAVSAASALAANGANCPAGQAALGVDTAGNVEGCWTPAAPGGAPRLDEVINPSSDKTFTMGNNHLSFNWTAPVAGTFDGAVEFQASGAFSGDLVHIHQFTGNPPAGTHLIHAEASDPDIVPLHISSANADAITTAQRITAGSFSASAASGNALVLNTGAKICLSGSGCTVASYNVNGWVYFSGNGLYSGNAIMTPFIRSDGSPTTPLTLGSWVTGSGPAFSIQVSDVQKAFIDKDGAYNGPVIGNVTGTASGNALSSHSHTTSQISGLDAGADFTAGTLPQTRGGTGAGALTCTGAQKITSNGTAYSCAADADTIYTHPANHPPSIITQDANNRFVTDVQIADWNSDADTIYVHPATHPPSIISGDGALTISSSANAISLDPNALGGPYPGIWFGTYAASKTAQNYSFLADSSGTMFNAPTGKSLFFRINNLDKLTVNGTAASLALPLDLRAGVKVFTDDGNETTYGSLRVDMWPDGAFVGTVAGSNPAANILRLGTNYTTRATLTNTSFDVTVPITSSSNPVMRKVAAPATSTTACAVGDLAVDTSYIYVCRAANSWVRSAAASW